MRSDLKYKNIMGAIIFALLLVSAPIAVEAYYGDGCEQYGSMSYASGGYCKCMAGYVFDTSVTGTKYCTDANLVCHNKLGYSSRYDSLSESCECSYGYVLGKDSIGRTQCVSPDSICKDQLGYSARYNSVYDKCECGYGDVISGGRCTDGDLVCHSKHGLYSSYDDSSNSCECNSGYTLDDTNQCVKKQNNTYFKLLDIDTDNKQAIVKSEYDSRKYLVTYGAGCYSSSIKRYRGRDIVINLGTDFDLDIWDTIVLQDDDETCDIRRRERTYDDTLEADSADDSIYNVPTYTAPTKASIPTPPKNVDLGPQLTNDERCVKLNLGTFYNTDKQNCDTCPLGTERKARSNICQKPVLVPATKKVTVASVKATPSQKSADIIASATQETKGAETISASTTTMVKGVDEKRQESTGQQGLFAKVFSSVKDFFSRMFK